MLVLFLISSNMNASLSFSLFILSNCNAINSLSTTGFEILKQRKRIVKITDNKELMCYFFFAKKEDNISFFFSLNTLFAIIIKLLCFFYEAKQGQLIDQYMMRRTKILRLYFFSLVTAINKINLLTHIIKDKLPDYDIREIK